MNNSRIPGREQAVSAPKTFFRLRLIRDIPDGIITLNSSPYGLPFYQALGFRPTDDEQTANGIRFTPMEYRVNADLEDAK